MPNHKYTIIESDYYAPTPVITVSVNDHPEQIISFTNVGRVDPYTHAIDIYHHSTNHHARYELADLNYLFTREPALAAALFAPTAI